VDVRVEVGVGVWVDVEVAVRVLVRLNAWEGVFEGVPEIVREAVHDWGGVAVGKLVKEEDAVEVRVGVGVSVGEGETVITAARIRILWLPPSATMTFPELLSTATPRGALKSAAVPTPLILPVVVPVEPPPASVVTTPVGVIDRILLLTWSTTMTFPELLSTAMPSG
jgi:hypothetical protein